MEIKNMEVYTNQLRLSLEDKLWFLPLCDQYQITTIVDYGCADGALLAEIHRRKPNLKLIGYDNNPLMLTRAKKQYPFLEFSSNFQEIPVTPSTLLVLSSVLHEIYNYTEPAKLRKKMQSIFQANYQFIAIRDMGVSQSCFNKRAQWIPNESRMTKMQKYTWDDFGEFWGIGTQRDIIHYLLKYRYLENWERELAENYLPIAKEEFLEYVWRYYRYQPLYIDHYTLPFLKEQVMKDFGYQITDATHIKLFLVKNMPILSFLQGTRKFQGGLSEVA